MRPSMRALAVVVALALVVGCSDDADTADTTQSAEPIGPEVAGIDFGILDLPPGDPYEGYMVVGDDTGVFELEVPEDWSFLTTEPVPWGMFPFVQASQWSQSSSSDTPISTRRASSPSSEARLPNSGRSTARAGTSPWRRTVRPWKPSITTTAPTPASPESGPAVDRTRWASW